MMGTFPFAKKEGQRTTQELFGLVSGSVFRWKPWKLGILGVLIIVGFFVPAGLKSLLMIIYIYSIFAMAYDVLLGYANQPSLGQSLFFGIGAYSIVLPVLRLGASFWDALVVAIAAGTIAAVLVGLLAVRVTEAYHVILTAIIASVVYLLAKNMTPLTGGSGGLPTDMPPVVVGPLKFSVYDPSTCYLILLAFAFIVYLVLEHLIHSPLGRVWIGIRENEVRTSFLRYNVFYYKLAVFVLAGALTALSGALYAVRLRYSSAEFFAFNWSVLPFVWGVLGGFGTLIGPIAGVALFTLFQFYVSAWWTHYLILFGCLIIVMLRWAPKGILGYINEHRTQHIKPERESHASHQGVFKHFDLMGIGQIRSHAGIVASDGIAAKRKHHSSVSNREGQPILETFDLVVKFGGMTALDGVNLRVLAGELRAIIGPNGAGKTTLFNAITGAVKPSSGRVLLRGKNITHFQPHKICRNGIARTFQIPNIFSELSVKENVWLGVNSKVKVPWNPVARVEKLPATSYEAERLCEMVGLIDKMHAMASSLSYGDQRLLEIAVALSLDPDILLLDEPTQGVDPREVENMNKIVRGVAEWKTVLVIDHNMATVLDIAQTITVLDHGRIIAEGKPSDIVANKRVQEVYLGISRD
jgi:branched-chain amino acid transport system ATP-binding protein